MGSDTIEVHVPLSARKTSSDLEDTVGSDTIEVHVPLSARTTSETNEYLCKYGEVPEWPIGLAC